MIFSLVVSVYWQLIDIFEHCIYGDKLINLISKPI
jgi:hypothetical protein